MRYKRPSKPMEFDGEIFDPDWTKWTARKVTKAQLALLVECRLAQVGGFPLALTRKNLMSVRNLVANNLLRIEGGYLFVTERGEYRADAEFERVA